jgi:hypothetical protein
VNLIYGPLFYVNFSTHGLSDIKIITDRFLELGMSDFCHAYFILLNVNALFGISSCALVL